MRFRSVIPDPRTPGWSPRAGRTATSKRRCSRTSPKIGRMIAVLRPRRATIWFALLCSIGALTSIWRVSGWGNELSAVDRFSEANALREVRHFREMGLTHDYGLGRVFYPGMYPLDGFEAEAALSSTPIQGVSPEGVYTHYPPGPGISAVRRGKAVRPRAGVAAAVCCRSRSGGRRHCTSASPCDGASGAGRPGWSWPRAR